MITEILISITLIIVVYIFYLRDPEVHKYLKALVIAMIIFLVYTIIQMGG